MSCTHLPLWVVPAEDEPAHSILIRLAERNGIKAPSRVSSLTGLTVRELRNGIGIELLASVIKCDDARIRRSTPVSSDGGLAVRGERIGRRDIKTSIRRLCPQCVAESAHHRFWYDLEFVSTCPRHVRNLVHMCSCGRSLSWNDVSIAKCRHCKDGDVTLIPETAVNPDVLEADRWALSRLGVGVKVAVSILDAMPLSQALTTTSQIGALDIGGYREHWTEARDLDLPAAEVRSRGFQVLKDGRLDVVLDRVYEEFLASTSGKPATMKNAYGWFGDWFSSLPVGSFPDGIAEIVLANASRNFRTRRGEPRQA